MYLIFAISNRCELNDFWHCIHKWSWCKFSINKQGLKKCIQKGLKKYNYSIYMDMNTVTLPTKGLKTRPYNIGMNKRDLKKLTKVQLIILLLKQQAQKPRNSVKQMVNEHEDIIQPPEQFRDTYQPIPPPRTGKWESVKPKPVPPKSVKQMVKEYEDIIQPPEQYCC